MAAIFGGVTGRPSESVIQTVSAWVAFSRLQETGFSTGVRPQAIAKKARAAARAPLFFVDGRMSQGHPRTGQTRTCGACAQLGQRSELVGIRARPEV